VSESDYRFLLGVLLGIRLALQMVGRQGEWHRRTGGL
jgi:hypothetical protein